MTDEEVMEGLEIFAKKLFDSQKELPEEFKKILDDNFWELCEAENELD